MLHVAEPFIVREAVRKGDMKTCDFCGRILTVDTTGAEGCFITEQGLVCAECVCKIKPMRVSREDDSAWSGVLY